MLNKAFSRALACASLIAVAAAATPASAQQIDRIVAFGDSYADNGNQFELIGVPFPSVYSTGRFSGGTNYIDTLSALLSAPVDNFAIGGALTNNTNTVTGPTLGFTTEYQSFLAGGGPAAFPRVSGTFGPNDLLAISIGGNDARLYQQSGGSLAGAPVAAAQSVINASTGLDALVNAGAQNISFLAGNTALLPEVQAQPNPATAGAVRQAFSSAFNNGMQQTLSGYAADGVIVHYLDLSVVAQQIQANPSAYGVTNLGPCPMAQATQCVTDPNFANQYLFYVDGLHLTSHGFEIVGQYIARQLAAPLTLQAPSDLGLDTARQFGRTLSTRSDLYGRGGAPDGLKLFAVGDFFSRGVRSSDDTAAFDIDGVGGTIGAEYGLPMGAVGIAGNYSRPRVRFGNESARINAHSWQLGAYGSLASGGLFGQAYLGYGRDKNRISRQGVVDDMSANVSGSHVTAGAKAGYLMPVGPARIGPIVALDYAHAKVDGYTENGDPVLTLNVGHQSLKEMTGQIGLEVRADFTGIRPFLALTAEHDFSGDGRLIQFAQTDAPTIVNQWSIGRSKDTYGRAQFGAAADLWRGASLDAAVTTTLGRDGGQEMGAHVGVRAKF